MHLFCLLCFQVFFLISMPHFAPSSLWSRHSFGLKKFLSLNCSLLAYVYLQMAFGPNNENKLQEWLLQLQILLFVEEGICVVYVRGEWLYSILQKNWKSKKKDGYYEPSFLKNFNITKIIKKKQTSITPNEGDHGGYVNKEPNKEGRNYICYIFFPKEGKPFEQYWSPDERVDMELKPFKECHKSMLETHILIQMCLVLNLQLKHWWSINQNLNNKNHEKTFKIFFSE